MSPNHRKIALIGFMASGKTSVGRVLGALRGLDFADLDETVTHEAGMDIPAIFAAEGEAGFRHLESLLLERVCGRDRIVLSTGGGVILDPANRALLRKNFTVVWIRIDVAEAVRRVALAQGTRPLLAQGDPLARARELLAFREKLYSECADFAVDTDSLSTAHSVAEKIHEYLGSPR